MENKYSDDTFLARWLNGTLEDQERMAFEQSEDFTKYQKIIASIDRLDSPAYDKKNLLVSIRENIKQKPKTVTLIPNWAYGVAASLLVLFGIFYFSNQPTTLATDYGEHITHLLPDGSEVVLNAQSEIKYQASDWENSREIYLNGEAFFKVKKGSKFNVTTQTGTVEVLGTQFNVNTQEDFFEIICIEGKVKAIPKNTTNGQVLTKGKALRSVDNRIEKWETLLEEPRWIFGESSFHNTPLKQVIHSLENQFNITFIKKNIDEKERFTGSYSHTDMDIALKTIFVPMEISYTFKNENTVVLVKE